MTLRKRYDDTIVAIATPSGRGGIGLIRLSGPDALAIADRIFLRKGTSSSHPRSCPSEYQSHTVHYGYIMAAEKSSVGHPAEVIDEVLLAVMRAPRSYTKEDVVEISCHGGMVPLAAILRRVIECGGRLAEPGEFTKRAFLNGRIDLTQAEAVLDIIQAKTETFLKVSASQLKGELSVELENIRQRLMAVYTTLEAVINFPEEEGVDSESLLGGAGVHLAPPFLPLLQEARQQVEVLLESSRHGKVLREGIKIVICGKPNVGKSSLLNVLLKEPRAIVSPIAGTTRDTIEETAQIKGIPLQLVDTAGILAPRDTIEEEAVRRSRQSISGADLVLFVLDATTGITAEDETLYELVGQQNLIIVVNKTDCLSKVNPAELSRVFPATKVIAISALKHLGIEEIQDAVVENVWHSPTVETAGIMVTNLRHIQALERCGQALSSALAHAQSGLSSEFVSEEVKDAVRELDTITGRDIDSDLLENIFSQFCIGK